MSKLKAPLTLLILALIQPIFAGRTFAQTNVSPPLSYKEVQGFWDRERSSSASYKNITSQAVTTRGVLFEVDFPREEEMQKAGMPVKLIDEIKMNLKAGTIVVHCEPVECEVTINDDAVGETYASELTKPEVPAGTVKVAVAARNFVAQNVSVQLEAGEHKPIKFVLQPPTAKITVRCTPSKPEEVPTMPECALQIIGPNGPIKSATTAEHKLLLDSLKEASYRVQAQALGYKTRTDEKYVNTDTSDWLITLEPDECARITPLQMFDNIVYSLGGKDVLTKGTATKGAGRWSLTGDPSSIGTWKPQFTEYTAGEPNRTRWELKIAGTSWNVAFDGSKVRSKGDKKYFGTEFAQELEESIRLVSDLRLPNVLAIVLAKTDIKHTCTENGYTLVGESPEDRYTFRLDKAYQPKLMLHEHLVAPQSSQEIEFGQYKKVQNLNLPHVLILRYPSRPKHEHIFEYDQIEVAIPIKDQIFKQ